MPAIVPNLWFDLEAEEAAEFYVSVFPHSKINAVTRYTDVGPRAAGTVLTVEFTLDGHKFVGLNGGPEFPFTEAVSFEVTCADQQEIDYYWSALMAGGGSEVECGWLKDRYGVSWQVVPGGMTEMINDPDRERADRVMRAMLGMKKIDIAGLEAAARG